LLLRCVATTRSPVACGFRRQSREQVGVRKQERG
jgi:hypothetical protein